MSAESERADLTVSLEDYLETIYELVREKSYARVRDIARAREVKAGSVSPAMRRLAELGYIEYVRREYIALTPVGEEAARRIRARHDILTRFLSEVLGMSYEQAERDACAVEHSMSNEAMDCLTRFFEFVRVCPTGNGLLERFHGCALIRPERSDCGVVCEARRQLRLGEVEESVSLTEIKPGERGVVTQVEGRGAIRQRLLDMGILPDVVVQVERIAPSGETIWIKLHGFQLSLRRREAEAVKVLPA
jgi:DtxR family Mn-dependent transcriptional regulator